jgi:predicted nucleic acid-binding protein
MLEQFLDDGRVRMHPFVIGELAMGSLANRSKVMQQLHDVYPVRSASNEEVMHLVENGPHHGSGLGWVDAHLLAAVLLTKGMSLWTRDRRLNNAATRYGRAAALHH